MNASPTIGFVGMTHLGLCSAVASASKGFVTIGIDGDDRLTMRLDAGDLPVVEPGLDDLLAHNRAKISFTSDPQALSRCDVVYVAPDVPTDDQGRSDLAPVERLLEFALRHSRPDTVVVLLSQVPPGFTHGRQRAGRILYYQVETLVFGRAVERATMPERFIVGCADPKAGLPTAYRTYLEAFGCPILPMRFESAELAKISINCCLVASVSVANTLAELCEKIDADWSEIAPALKLDRRIGAYAYLAPGLGIAGGNLERDLATVCRMADAQGTDAGVVRAWIANSRYRKNWALRTLHEQVLGTVNDPKITVLGLAYKEDTHSTKNSPALELIEQLGPYELTVHDPIVAASVVPRPVCTAPTPIEACRGADVVLIMTPWRQFRDIAPAELAQVMKGKTVIDPFRILDADGVRRAGLRHVTLGAPPAESL